METEERTCYVYKQLKLAVKTVPQATFCLFTKEKIKVLPLNGGGVFTPSRLLIYGNLWNSIKQFTKSTLVRDFL